MVKVGVLTSLHPVFDIRIFHRECCSLARAGYDVTLIAPHDSSLERNGVRVMGVEKSQLRGRIARGLQMSWRVYRAAKNLSADIYHFHDPELMPIGLLLHLQGKKVIYDVHEDLPSDLNSRERSFLPRWSRRYVAWAAKQVEEWIAGKVDAVVTAGEDITFRLKKFAAETVTVPNFPILEEYTSLACPLTRYQSKTLVSFGGVSEARAIQQQIEALGQLPKNSGIRLVLGGRTFPAQLEEMKLLPGWNLVDYRGPIERKEMIEAMARAAVAVILFAPGPNHQAIRSNRFYESLAAGLPVIVPNFGEWDLAERMGCGICVDSTDPQSIARAIEYLCTHPEVAAAMGARGKKLVQEKFCWEREESKLIQLYARLVLALPKLSENPR